MERIHCNEEAITLRAALWGDWCRGQIDISPRVGLMSGLGLAGKKVFDQKLFQAIVQYAHHTTIGRCPQYYLLGTIVV